MKQLPKTFKNISQNSTATHIQPGFSITTLDNGLKIMVEEVPTVESFALGIWVKTGTRDEPNELAGLAHFIEHMTFRRTATRSSRQIASQFESVGAYTNAFTTKEHTCFYVRALKQHFKKTLRLLADVMLHPAFHPADFEKEKLIILEEIKSYEDEPEELIIDFSDRQLFGSHPLGNPILGTAETVLKTEIRDIQKFYSEEYHPANMIVSVVGNVKRGQVEREIEALFKNISAFTPRQERNRPKLLKASRLEISKPVQQAHFMAANIVPGVRSQERYALAVLNTLLGDGMSSRLYQRVRERWGLAYTVYSSLQLMTDIGVMSIYAGMDDKNVLKTEKIITEELLKLSQKPVSKPELQRAKEQLKSSIIMSLESMSERMQMMAKGELEEGGYEDASATIAAIDTVSADDLLRLMREYGGFGDWSTVVILPE
jgi:predicted Zn-dependent peptidase